MQVESLLAVYVMGILSGIHRFPTHSQLIDLKGAGTQEYSGQGICWLDPNLRVSRWMGGLFRAADLLVSEGPAGTGTISTYLVTFLFTIYFHRSISTPRKKHPPFFFPVCGRRAGLGQWTSLSNRSEDSCCLLSPGPLGTRIPQWEHNTYNTRSLIFIEKALLK